MRIALFLLCAAFSALFLPGNADAQLRLEFETPSTPLIGGTPRPASENTWSGVLRAAEHFLNPEETHGEMPRSAREWRHVDPTHYNTRANEANHHIAAIEAIDPYLAKRADPQFEINRAILLRLLRREVGAHDHDTARLPFTGDYGFHMEPIFYAMSLRLQSETDAENWIAKLNDVSRYFRQHEENMRRGIATGYTAHKDPFASTMAQLRGIIDTPMNENALYRPFESMPDTIPFARARVLKIEGRAAVLRVMQDYTQLQLFFESTYAPAVRIDPSLSSLVEGPAIYAYAVEDHTAGAGYSPEEIHQIGLREVASIRAQMEDVIAEVGFEGEFEAFLIHLRTDRSFYASSPSELLFHAAMLSKRLDAMMPQYFGLLPRLPYGVEAVPHSIAPGYTTGRYQSGDIDDGKAGMYWVNTFRLDQRPLYELPALTAHEAVPGHHLQISLAQELGDDLPAFRHSYYATAFGEGWGLYAERLVGEAGFYQTPYERFGALSYEMWRACRLVADTGLHYYGWSREEAEACFLENSALSPLNIQVEVTRYIGWPGQAVAYKIGQLKILELRAQAREALGARFDIRAFHDEVLGAGSLPLDVLETRINLWIARELAVIEALPK